MKFSPIKIIRYLLCVILCVSIVGIALQQLGYTLSERSNAEAMALVGLTELEAGKDPSETSPIETDPWESADEIEQQTDAEPETIPESETAQETISETEAETLLEADPETNDETSTATAVDEGGVTDAYAEQLLLTDLSALKEKNEDVFGWIVIPDTTISYPLLQGTDNTHYLYYNWEGLWSWAGSIFMDYRSSTDMTDFHTILYGHRMNNDSMFNGLKHYADPEFAKEHPSVYILTEAGVWRYDIFAAYEADVEGHSYRLGLEAAQDRQKLINYCLRNSVIPTDMDIRAEEGARMLTMSTCTKEGTAEARWVVHAVLSFELPK